MTSAEALARPALRYHGGKWRLAPWIISHFPAHRIYVEPYGGAGSVFFQKPRAYAEVLNDMDDEVVNVFRVLRDEHMACLLVNALSLTPFARSEFVSSYKITECPVERARRAIVRSFMGFGSAAINHEHRTGFRGKSFRSGTSPAADWRNYPNCVHLFTERLQGVAIECRPALELISYHDRSDVLFYIDPPYPRGTRYGGKCYRYEMTNEDHVELSKVLHQLKGMVVLSGYDCDLYRNLFGDWKMISHKWFADGAKPRVECLWLSPNISTTRQGMLLAEGC